MYAVNIVDLQAHHGDIGLVLLIAPVIDLNREPIKTEYKRIDGIGIPLNCDEERAQAIVEIVRKKYQKHQMRFYHSKTGKGWKRV